MNSKQYQLANKDGLSLVTSESWNGRATEISVDLILTKAADGTQERILRQPLIQWGDDLRTLPHDGVFPSIKSVVEEGGKMAILYSTMVTTAVDGHYLLLDRTGDVFRKAGELDLDGLFPTTRTIKWEEPLEARLQGLDGIHMVHHDRFTVDIQIASDNSVTMNGKPCAPGNSPIKWLNYRHFLHALSPTTAQSYDGNRENPEPILWWGKAALSPPFRYEDYLQMSKLIQWVTPPAIDKATVPESLKAAMPAGNSPVSSQAPNVSSVSSAGNENIPKASPPVPATPVPKPVAPTGNATSSTPWGIIAIAVVAAITLLLVFLKKQR